MHGGAGMRGVANPAFKDGRKSKHMPQRMMEDVRAAALDPELHSLRENITILEARMADLLKRVDTGESGAIWKELRDALKQYNASREPDEQAYWLHEITVLIADGHADTLIWNEITELMEKQRRLMDSERKRMMDMKALMGSDRVMAIFIAVANIIKKHVVDPAALRAISYEMTALLNVGERAD